MLDHSLIAFGTRHERRPGALVLSAAARTGRQRRRPDSAATAIVIAPEWTPVANLWLGVAGMFGSPLEQVGESTGAIRDRGMMRRRSGGWALVAGLAAAVVASSPAGALEPLPRLIEAVKAGDRKSALALVAEQDGVNAAEADGTTALHWAAEGGDRELVAALLKAGADSDGRESLRRHAAAARRRERRRSAWCKRCSTPAPTPNAASARGRDRAHDRRAHGLRPPFCACCSSTAPTSRRARIGTARRR